MNWAIVLAAFLLAAFPVAAGTPSHGPAALRALAVSPKLDITVGYKFGWRDGQQVIAEGKDPQSELRKLQAAVKEQPGDVWRMVELAEWLENNGSTNDARSGWHDVEKLCRKHLEVNANDTVALLQLGQALDGLEHNAEAESVYRRAVAVSSNDWRCWAGLGSFLQGRARELLVSKHSSGRIQLSPHAAANDWLDGHPTSDALQQSEKLSREADRCLEHVLALAPKEPDAWVQLAAHAACSNLQSRLAAHFKNEDRPVFDSAGLAAVYFCPACVADLKQAARLDRTNYTLIAGASMFALAELGYRKHDAPRDSFREAVREEMLFLEDLGRQPNKKAAAGALAALGFVHLMLEDKAGALARLREALADDPTLHSAWEFLLGLSVESSSPAELVALCETRLKHEDTTRNRLFLCKAFLRQQKAEKADEQAQTILKLEPNNLMAVLILVASDLQRSENPQFMVEAYRHIIHAAELLHSLLPGADSADRWREIKLNTAIWCGLQDDPAIRQTAARHVQSVLQQTPDDQTAKDILQALE